MLVQGFAESLQQVGSGTSKYGNQCDCRLSLSNDVYETTIYIENITLVMKTTQQTRARGNSHMRHIYSTCSHCRSQQKELERERMANFSIDSILGNLTNTQTPRRLPTKRSFSVPAAPLPVLPLTGENTFLQTFGPVQQSGLLVPKMPALLTLSPTPQRCVSTSEEPARSPLFAVETTVFSVRETSKEDTGWSVGKVCLLYSMMLVLQRVWSRHLAY